MADPRINYTKEAFLAPANLAFLLVAMLATFFLVGPGPVDELILLFTAAAELLYLGYVPRQDRFRRLVKSRKMQEDLAPPSEKEQLRLLSRDSQRRYVRFRNLEQAIRENYKKLPYASQGMLDAHLQKIDGLLDSYLGLLQLQERYERFTERNAQREVVEAINALKDEMETDPPKVRSIKERRLRILEKRLDKFKKAHENLAVIEAQLGTVEDVTKYVHEQSLTMRNPDEITFQLDTLLSEVEETQQSIEELDEVFSPTGAAGPLLDAEDLDAFEPPAAEKAAPRPDRLRSRE